MVVLQILNNPQFKKKLFLLTIFILLFYILIFIYSFIFERDKIAIDNYNFNQLRDFKNLIKDKEITNFYNIITFNNSYNGNIKPIKNCYFISSYNGNEPYIFGFQLESLIYKSIFLGKNYIYPKYNVPYSTRITDRMYINHYGEFNKIVSNPCMY